MRIPPCGDYGDVDGDGYVTEEDAIAAARHYYGTDLFPDGQLSGRGFARADVNSDGVVAMEDAAMIAEYAVGTTETFPACVGYGDDAKTVFKTFAAAAVIAYVVVKIIWR